MLKARTLVIKDWSEVPLDIRGDCLITISPGVHRHVRTNTVVVDLHTANRSGH